LPITYTAFFDKPEDKEFTPRKKEAPWTMLGPIIGTTVGIVLLGVFAGIPGFPLFLADIVLKQK